MVALPGIYEKGMVRLLNQPLIDKADVLVVFPNKETDEKAFYDDEARKLFDKFTGSINRVIDEKAERLEALDEKYQSIN
jgi:hypothetical protein